MAPPVDPNEVLMTGENSFIRLSRDNGQTISERFSHWRVLWCPAGAGHALFAKTAALGDAPRVYSDNPAVARWLQRTIETLLFPAFADANLPVYSATFARAGDSRSAAVESIVAGNDVIRMSWWDCLEPFVLNAPPGFNDRPIGVFSTFFPARSAQIQINGAFVPGQVVPEKRGDRDSSSACLAWSETWVKPRK